MSLPQSIAVIILSASVGIFFLLSNHVQAEAETVEIGQIVPPEQLHIVREPGRYGLGPDLPGSHYAVAGDQLIRIDATTRKVQSIIRTIDRIRD